MPNFSCKCKAFRLQTIIPPVYLFICSIVTPCVFVCSVCLTGQLLIS